MKGFIPFAVAFACLACSTAPTASVSGTSGGTAVASSGTGSGGTGEAASGGASGSATGSGGSSGTGEAASGGASGSATSSGGSVDAACVGTACALLPDGGAPIMIGEYCGCDADCCGGGLHCALHLGSGICEPSCGSDADCPEPFTVCADGGCVPVSCGGPAGGPYVGPCTLASPNDGSCLPPPGGGTLFFADGGLFPLGLCVLGGSAATGTRCDPLASRSDPSSLCIDGDVCLNAFDGGLNCVPVCDLNGDGGCASGTLCAHAWESSGPWGLCQ